MLSYLPVNKISLKRFKFFIIFGKKKWALAVELLSYVVKYESETENVEREPYYIEIDRNMYLHFERHMFHARISEKYLWT